MPKETDDTRLVTTLLIIVGALAVFPVLFMGIGMMGFGSMTGGMWGSGMWDGGMWGSGTTPGWLLVVGIAVRLLFSAAIIGGAYLIYRAVADTESGSDRAMEELRLAYARGDLTDEEYDQRREALERDTDSR